MARGFLSGAIWGTILSVAGLGVASVMMPGPGTVQPAPPDQPSETAMPAETEVPVGTATETVKPSDQTDAAEEVAPEPEALTLPEAEPDTESDLVEAPSAEVTVDAADTPTTEADAVDDVAVSAPTDAPEDAEPSEAAAASASDTATMSETPARRPTDVSPVAPEAAAPELEQPKVPTDSAPANADTSAAPMPTPETGDTIAALDAPDAGTAPAAPSSPTDDATPDTATAPALAAPEGEANPSLSTEPAQPPVPAVPNIETPLAPDGEGTATGEAAPDAQDTAVEDTPAGVQSEDSATAATRPPVRRLIPTEPDTGQSDSAALRRPAIGTPAASLTDRNPGNSARLPSIGSATEDDSSAVQPSEVDTNLPPLKRFAASVDSDPALPKMSIVLIDDGSGPLGPDTLDGFPFPVTFALDPAQSGAAERMSRYRALGYEVAVLVNLPAAAQPSDVEQALGGAVAAVPEAVALIEAPDGGLQADRTITEQAARFAADSGHGLVFLPNGLNTAQALAQRETVPALSILRDFDGDGQDARTKRRFLDGAAFRARQDGSVTMLGRLTPDTLSALVLWSLQDRAASVSMVPVSTLLIDQAN